MARYVLRRRLAICLVSGARVAEVCLLAALAGCATAPAGSSATELTRRASEPLDVSVSMDALGPGQVEMRFVKPNDQVHSGEGVRFKVRVTQPAYVYVVWYASKGWSTVLFPDAGDRQVSPGEDLTVTNRGARIELDENVGQENVYVLASNRPMSPDLRTQLRIASGRDEPPPEGVPPDKRGDDLRSLESASAVHLRADATGVALLRFRFQHIP